MSNTKTTPESIMEAQSKVLTNWMETTQKLQKAWTGGQSMDKGSEIYNEWLKTQMNILSTAVPTATESTLNNTDYYKNWFNTQMSFTKQLVDMNQNIMSSFMNFGKPWPQANDSFTTMNNAWNTVYNNYITTMNKAYENMTNVMPNGFSKETFENMFKTQNTYLKMQEIMEPIFKTITTGNYNPESWKTIFDMNKYKQVTETMFGSYFPFNTNNELFPTYLKQLETYFTNNTTTSKEFYTQYQNLVNEWPTLFNNDWTKMNSMMTTYTNNVFGKTFEPLLKMMAPSKDKTNAELTITLMDKMTAYSMKQSQLQYLLYTTGQKVAEQSLKFLEEKAKLNNGEVTNFQPFFNEWTAMNEKIYIELFASDEFATAKAAVLDLSLGIKKDFETQFEHTFAAYPVVFRSEIDELYKTIHDLKNKVKTLESQLTTSTFINEVETTSKTKKK